MICFPPSTPLSKIKGAGIFVFFSQVLLFSGKGYPVEELSLKLDENESRLNLIQVYKAQKFSFKIPSTIMWEL